MIFLSGSPFDVSKIIREYSENSIERQILNAMSTINEKYHYDNLNQLKFELRLRKEIVNSAMELNNGDFAFSSFRSSKCNPKYWIRTSNGGFLLKEDVRPSEAVNDIFTNGNKYATECATAIMIIYYKALLTVFHEERFDELFSSIYLMDWDVTEPLLKEVTDLQNTTDVLLGDRGYFNNPDFDPDTPEWRGENVIVLPDSMYYGHGIGITTANGMINALNSHRMEGATQSSYFTDLIGRPNFNKLADVFYNRIPRTASLVWGPFPPPITS